MEQTRMAVAERAADLLKTGFVLIDLETTGLSDNPTVEVVEVTALDHNGTVLMDTLVKPEDPIPSAASRVHGIYADDVQSSPTFPGIYPQLAELLNGKTVLAYNYTFERDILRAVCRRHKLDDFKPLEWWCPMRAYQVFNGTRRYTKLTVAAREQGIRVENAHRAVGDCIMTLELVKKMAAVANPPQPSLF